MTSKGVVTAAASAPLLHPHNAAWVAPVSLPPWNEGITDYRTTQREKTRRERIEEQWFYEN